MFGVLLKIFSFFMGLWGGLSDSQKEKIIDLIVESFEGIFRKFFQESKSETSNG